MPKLVQQHRKAALARVGLIIRNQRNAHARWRVTAIERAHHIDLCLFEHPIREPGHAVAKYRRGSTHSDGNMSFQISRTKITHELVQRFNRGGAAVESTALVFLTQDRERIEICLVEIVELTQVL